MTFRDLLKKKNNDNDSQSTSSVESSSATIDDTQSKNKTMRSTLGQSDRANNKSMLDYLRTQEAVGQEEEEQTDTAQASAGVDIMSRYYNSSQLANKNAQNELSKSTFDSMKNKVDNIAKYYNGSNKLSDDMVSAYKTLSDNGYKSLEEVEENILDGDLPKDVTSAYKYITDNLNKISSTDQQSTDTLGALAKQYVAKHGYTEDTEDYQAYIQNAEDVENYYKNSAKEIQNAMSDFDTEQEYKSAVAQAEEDAKTSDDLQKEYDKKKAEYDSTWGDFNKEYAEIGGSYNNNPFTTQGKNAKKKLQERTDQRTELDNLQKKIDQKKELENEKKYYTDFRKQNPEVAKTLDAYYDMQSYEEEHSKDSFDTYNKDALKEKLEKGKSPTDSLYTDEEKKAIETNFNSLKTLDGWNVDQIYKYYKRAKDREKAEKENENIKDFADKHPIASTAISTLNMIPSAFESSPKQVASVVDKWTGGDGYYNPEESAVYQNNLLQQKVASNIDNPLGRLAYQQGVSLVDNAIRMGIAYANPAVGLSMMGAEVATQGFNDTVENGGSVEQALFTGLAYAGVEVLTEGVSLGKLKSFKNGGVKEFKSILKNAGKQILTEASEEVSATLLDSVADEIINGSLSQLETEYDRYIDSGMSETEAGQAVMLNYGGQIIQDAIGGALMGGISGTAVNTSQYRRNIKAGKSISSLNNIDTVKNLAKHYGLNNSVTDYESNPTDARLGALQSEAYEKATESMPTEKDFKRVIKKANLASDENVVANKLTNGENLTDDDLEKIKKSESLKSLLANDVVNQAKSARFNQQTALLSADTKLFTPSLIEFNAEKSDADANLNNAETLDKFLSENSKNMTINTDTVDKMKDAYNGLEDKIEPDTFAMEYARFFNQGVRAVAFQSLNSTVSQLPYNVQVSAYEDGLNKYTTALKAGNALSKLQQEWKDKTNGYAKGTVDTSALEGIKLNDEQKASVDYISGYANHGLNVKFYASRADENGVYIDDNGGYDSLTNTIMIDINAKKETINDVISKGAMMSTFGHELSHLAEHAPTEYAELSKAIQDAVGADTFNDAVDKHYSILEERNSDKWQKMSEDKRQIYATREAVAEFSSDLVNKAKILEKMSKENPSVGKKFINLIKKVISKIKSILKDNRGMTDEARLLANDLASNAEKLQSIVDKYEKAVIEGLKNQNAKVHTNKSSVKENNTKTQSNTRTGDFLTERERTLVATHNISSQNLMNLINDFDGAGLPVPSIAIEKADSVHDDFGDVTLLFSKDTIDPQNNSNNNVYSRDAWTSTFPQTEYKINAEGLKAIAKKLDLSENYLESNIFNTNDLNGIKRKFLNDRYVRKAFIEENNIEVTPVAYEKKPKFSFFANPTVKSFIKNNNCTFDRLVNDKEFRDAFLKVAKESIRLRIALRQVERFENTLDDCAKSKDVYSDSKESIEYCIEYAKGNAKKEVTEYSYEEGIENAINEHKAEFEKYIDDMLSESGVIGDKYIIRDDVNLYNNDGSRKSFEQTHYDYNIDNVVKAMKVGRSAISNSFFGGIEYAKTISAKNLNSIEEIKSNEHKLQELSADEIETQKENISNLLAPIIREIADSSKYSNREFDDGYIEASNSVVDAFKRYNTIDGVYKYLKQYYGNLKKSTINKLFKARDEIAEMPVRYFEAKPHRVVGFDEVMAVVIPADADEKLKTALKKMDIPMYEYADESQRADATHKAINTEYTDKSGVTYDNLQFSSNRGDFLSNREALAQALETTTINASERNTVKTYQQGLEQMNKLNDKLNEIDSKIKTINAKDNISKSDKAEIASLMKVKAETEEKIVNKDKNLLKLESTEAMRNILKYETSKKIARVREQKNERIAEIRKQETQKRKDAVAKLRKQKNDKIDDIIVKNREKRKADAEKRKDNQDWSHSISEIKKYSKKLLDAVLHPTEKMYIPYGLNEPIKSITSTLLDSINLDNDTKMSDNLRKLSQQLEQVNQSDEHYGDFYNAYNEEIIEEIKGFADYLDDRLEGVKIKKQTQGESLIEGLTHEEAKEIEQIVKDVYNATRDAVKQIGRQDAITNYESGLRIINQTRELGDVKLNVMDSLLDQVLSPMRLMAKYTGYNADAELMYHINALNEGTEKYNMFKMLAEKPLNDFIKENPKEYESFKNDVIEIKYRDNKNVAQTVKMTKSQGLQILMSWTREHTEDSHLDHMERGGVTLLDAEQISKGNYEKAFAQRKTIRGINLSFISAVQSQMGEFENHYRELAETLFNEVSNAYINDTSAILLHRDIATERYYIPFAVNKDFLSTEIDGLKYDATIVNKGMLKSTKRNAPQALNIAGLDSVISKHIRDVGQYYGYAVPIRNLNKALNVKLFDTNENGNKIATDSVRNSLRETFNSDKPIQFIEQVMTDLQTSRKSNSQTEKAINKIVRAVRDNMITSALKGSVSVVIKQGASLYTASSILSMRSVSVGAVKGIQQIARKGGWKQLTDEIDTHTAGHYMRRIGLSSMEIEAMKDSWLGKKLPTALNPAKWIQGTDCITTALHWVATKEEVSRLYKEQGKADQIGSDEYFDEVTKLYDQILEETQPMYDSLHRGEIQKNSNELLKSVFMFKTQPLQNTGILYDAIMDYQANKDNAELRDVKKQKLAKAVSSQMMSALTFVAMTFIASLALHKPERYKDENDEVTLSSVLERLGIDWVETGFSVLVPIGGAELASFIENQINGKDYDFASDNVVSMLNDFTSSIGDFNQNVIVALAQGNFDLDKAKDALWGLSVDGLAFFRGFPLKNYSNIINGIFSNLSDAISGHSTYFGSSGGRKGSEYANSYDVLIDNNPEKAKQQLETFYNEKYEEQIAKGETTTEAKKKAQTSVRTALTTQYKKEYQKAFLNNDRDTMQKINKKLQESGYMKWEGKSLSTVLGEWTKSAQKDSSK
nr:MAG TPA: nuclease [Caudoviricetes sp.]